MDVILLKDVEKLGLRGDVVSVTRGYMRNYLRPRKLAEQASEARVAELAKRESERARHEARTADQAEAIAETLRKTVLRFEVNAGERGTLFGSVTSTDITDEIWRTRKIRVDRRKIELRDPIKRIGRYEIPITSSRLASSEDPRRPIGGICQLIGARGLLRRGGCGARRLPAADRRRRPSAGRTRAVEAEETAKPAPAAARTRFDPRLRRSRRARAAPSRRPRRFRDAGRRGPEDSEAESARARARRASRPSLVSSYCAVRSSPLESPPAPHRERRPSRVIAAMP